MTKAVTATASGALHLFVDDPRQTTVANGEFTIHANADKEEFALPVGDGVNEQTDWSFDFKQDPAFSVEFVETSVDSARLVLVLEPQRVDSQNDTITIVDQELAAEGDFGGTTLSVKTLMEAASATEPEVGRLWVVEQDLLRMPDESLSSNIRDNILSDLAEHDGVVKMHYEDDSMLCFAALTLEEG